MWSPTQSVYKILILALLSLVIVKSDSSESIAISHSDLTDHLEHSSLIYGIFKEIRLNEDSECAQDTKVILDGIRNRDVWALKSMLIDYNEMKFFFKLKFLFQSKSFGRKSKCAIVFYKWK